MPDGDVFTRSLESQWRRPFQLLRDGGTVEEVAGALQWAAARYLRATDGVPGLRTLASIVDLLQRDEITAVDAVKQVRDIQREAGDNRQVWDEGEAVARLIVELAPGPSPSGQAGELVAAAYIAQVLDARFFAPVSGKLVGDRFPNVEAVQTTRDRLLNALQPDFRRFASQLARKPTGETVQARLNRRTSRRPTAEQLHEAIEV